MRHDSLKEEKEGGVKSHAYYKSEWGAQTRVRCGRRGRGVIVSSILIKSSLNRRGGLGIGID